MFGNLFISVNLLINVRCLLEKHHYVIIVLIYLFQLETHRSRNVFNYKRARNKFISAAIIEPTIFTTFTQNSYLTRQIDGQNDFFIF